MAKVDHLEKQHDGGAEFPITLERPAAARAMLMFFCTLNPAWASQADGRIRITRGLEGPRKREKAHEKHQHLPIHHVQEVFRFEHPAGQVDARHGKGGDFLGDGREKQGHGDDQQSQALDGMVAVIGVAVKNISLAGTGASNLGRYWDTSHAIP